MPGVLHDAGMAAVKAATGAARRHATVADALVPSPPHPAAGAMPAFCTSAPARPSVMLGDPESAMAPANRPADAGDASRAKMDVPPLDCPPSVTRLGSPPNPAMFACMCTSRRPCIGLGFCPGAGGGRTSVCGRPTYLDPAQCSLLVLNAVVAAHASLRGRQLCRRKEAKNVEPVVERDDNDAGAAARVRCKVFHRLKVAGAVHQPAAVLHASRKKQSDGVVSAVAGWWAQVSCACTQQCAQCTP